MGFGVWFLLFCSFALLLFCSFALLSLPVLIFEFDLVHSISILVCIIMKKTNSKLEWEWKGFYFTFLSFLLVSLIDVMRFLL